MTVLAFAMDPALTPDLIAPRQHAAFAELCQVPSMTPLEEFGSPGAAALLRDCEVLVTGWGCPRLDAGALALAPRLRLVLHAGGSVRPVVSEALWQRTIRVVSAAAANAVPVAEFALACILLANKQAFAAREEYRASRRWAHPQWVAPGTSGNHGATVGVVGASRTGRHLLELLRPFALRVFLTDPFVAAAEAIALGAELVGLDRLLAESDVVSLHAPLLPPTAGMIGAMELARMRDGATLLNTARGGLVDAAALQQVLRAGRLYAVLDVTDPEPLPPDSPLYELPNVVLTPHVAGATGSETQRMTGLVLDELRRWLAGDPLRHEVTRDMLDRVG